VLTRLDALAVGIAAWRLGAGRARKEDPVQAGAGVVMHAKPGDTVKQSEPVLTLFSDDPDRFARARAALEGGFDITPDVSGDRTTKSAADPQEIVLDRVS
jgi:thymidine phosphorylase